MKNKLFSILFCGVLTLPLFSCSLDTSSSFDSKNSVSSSEKIEFSEVLNFSKDDIKIVKFTNTSLSPQIGTLRQYDYSNNEEDISLIYDQYLSKKLVDIKNPIAPGNQYYEYICLNEEYEELFSYRVYGDIIQIQNKYFKVDNVITSLKRPFYVSFNFITYTDEYKIYENDEVIYEGNNLSKLDFVRTSNKINEKKEIKYKLSTQSIELELVSNTIFKYQDNFYMLMDDLVFFEEEK